MENSPFETLRAWLLQLPGVVETPHRFGGTEFRVEGMEFMHSHGSSLLDIRLSKQDQTAVLKTDQATPHRFAPQAGWVSFRLTRTEDLESARKIIQQAYDNAKNQLSEITSRRIQTRPS
jgi:predicted DNA-binding protein (MmcQ/YjbR family)